tara:strand:+ start:1137 stop:2414 length:1278 start_codon:yes stop_codon:yes gene_type:complete
LNLKQVNAIEQLFNSHPAVQAARTILHGQLLSGGIVLRRDGEVVDLKPAFKQHLDEVWVPFAQTVVDSFLKFGYVAVVYEEDESSLMSMSAKRQRGVSGKASVISNIIPIVPSTDTYEIAYTLAGRGGYLRKYFLYGTAPNMATKIDDEARVVVRQQPDPNGNINSPMATIFDLGSFTSALTELAITAEITNAKPRIWTQMQKEQKGTGLDPQALFFDSESRSLAASTDNNDSAQQANALAMQQQLCSIINKLQTTNPGSSLDVQTSSFSGSGSQSAGKFAHLPPEVLPSLFCLPKVRSLMCTIYVLPTAHPLSVLPILRVKRLPIRRGSSRRREETWRRSSGLRSSLLGRYARKGSPTNSPPLFNGVTVTHKLFSVCCTGLWSPRGPDVQRAVCVQVDFAVSALEQRELHTHTHTHTLLLPLLT